MNRDQVEGRLKQATGKQASRQLRDFMRRNRNWTLLNR